MSDTINVDIMVAETDQVELVVISEIIVVLAEVLQEAEEKVLLEVDLIEDNN